MRSALVALALVHGCGPTPPPSEVDSSVADGGGDAAPEVDAAPTEDASIDAAPPSHLLVVQIVGAGSGHVSDGAGIECDRMVGATCSSTFVEGTVVTLFAEPDAGATLTGWSVASCGAALQCDVTLDADLVVEARFALADQPLALEVTGNGEVDVSPGATLCTGVCAVTLPHDTVVTLTATPLAGERFVAWTDDCAATTRDVCVLTMDAPHTVGAVFAPAEAGLTVVAAGTGDGTVTSAPTGIACPGDCFESFASGASVMLTAAAAVGSAFVGWSGACSGTAATCTAVVGDSTVVVAAFQADEYDLEVTPTGTGAGRVMSSVGGIDCGSSCRDTYAHGTMVTLTAVPNASSTFTGWGGACAASGTSPTCTVTMTAAASVTAQFTIRQFAVTVTRSGTGTGTVSAPGIACGADCSEMVAYGTVLTLTETPSLGSSFSGWGGSCASAGTLGTCVLTIMSDASVSAAFTGLSNAVTVTVTGSRGGAGSVTSAPSGIVCGADCTETYAFGTPVTLTAVPAAGSTFLGWTGDAGCTGTGTCAFDATAPHTVGATFEGRASVRLSATDRDPAVRLRFDRLGAEYGDEHAAGAGGVRSDTGIAPGSGVFYYEAHRLTDDLGPCGAGVASASYPLVSASVGSTDQSFGMNIDGGLNYAGGYAGAFNAPSAYYGFVVDYRGATPIVYFIAELRDWGMTGAHDVAVVATQAMPAVTTPLFILVAGHRTAIDISMEINAGNDTTNFPFHYDPAALLRTAGHGAVADALVLGWGATYAGPADASPALVVSANQTVAAGTPVTVTATATDAEDGPLTPSITWELLSTPYYTDRTVGTGGSFSFTPTAIGIHPARATIVDSIGQVTTAVVRVTVTGAVAQHDPVILAPDARTGAGIVLSSDSLATRWTGFGKMGIRANQSCYGQFWYFEASRLVTPTNMGVGLVIGAGDLNPYDWSDVAGSMSVNVVGGTWRNLIPRRSFDSGANDHYGFAVDYRGEHPHVYVIVGGTVIDQMVLDDVWTEIFPMMYGNDTTTPAGSFDERINFGATAFSYDPVAALTASGIDPTGLEVGWGDANTP